MKQSLASLRKEYGRSELTTDSVKPDPIDQFTLWFREANEAEVPEPNAMTLCTASASGVPSGRVLLLKDVSPAGFTFYTNYGSRKASDLEENPLAAIVFWWRELERQVRVEGRIERVSEVDSDEYFASRPLGSRVGAWASPQSSVIGSRTELVARAAAVASRFAGRVPRPEFWGGYRLVPNMLEFWQGRANRLHDRIRYLQDGSEWRIERLAP